MAKKIGDMIRDRARILYLLFLWLNLLSGLKKLIKTKNAQYMKSCCYTYLLGLCVVC